MSEKASVAIGTSCLTRDLVWCECGRGLSLTGKWFYCPKCGRQIDQDSYAKATEQALQNGAQLYRNVDLINSSVDWEKRYQEALAAVAALLDRLDEIAPHINGIIGSQFARTGAQYTGPSWDQPYKDLRALIAGDVETAEKPHD